MATANRSGSPGARVQISSETETQNKPKLGQTCVGFVPCVQLPQETKQPIRQYSTSRPISTRAHTLDFSNEPRPRCHPVDPRLLPTSCRSKPPLGSALHPIQQRGDVATLKTDVDSMGPKEVQKPQAAINVRLVNGKLQFQEAVPMPISRSKSKSKSKSRSKAPNAGRYARQLEGDKENQAIGSGLVTAPHVKKLLTERRQPGNCVSPQGKGPHLGKMNTSVAAVSHNSLGAYQIGRQIGQGAYAVVKEAVQRVTQLKVALKIYEKHRLLNPERQKSVNREIQVLQRLSHPHIVKLIETIDTTKQLFLVFELVKGRSLYAHLKSKERRRLDETEARRLFAQVASGIAYCHSRGVSHRDIKLENILLDEHNNIKIIDFGFATCASPTAKHRVFCGTPSYMPPEIVSKKEYYGPQADMWTLGVLLFAMLSGSFPFKGATDQDLYRKIRKGEYLPPGYISSTARSLIANLLQVDPQRRLSCADVLRHSFLTDSRSKTTARTESYAKLL